MVSYMGWVLLFYGLAAVLVHFLHGVLLRRRPREKRLHYILVTHNHENQMEWYLRALSWYARLRGESVKVTVLDQASQDDTLAIIQRLQHEAGIELTTFELGSEVEEKDMGSGMDDRTTPIQNRPEMEEELTIRVDLRVPQEAAKIPFVRV